MMNKLLWISLIVTVLVDQGKSRIEQSRNFPDGIPIGLVIEIDGILQEDEEKTVINIQSDSCIVDAVDNIAMHIHFDESLFMILNHKRGGLWGRKKRLSFVNTNRYKLTITVFEDCFIIDHNQVSYKFGHRISLQGNSNNICIYGPPLEQYKDWL